MNRPLAFVDRALTRLMQWGGHLRVTARIDSDSDRLTLRFVSDGPIGRMMRKSYLVRRNPNSGMYERVAFTGYDFHSLLWEHRKGSTWVRHRTIKFRPTADASPRICELHSFDAANGTAILKMSECHRPEGSRTTSGIYSWRRWDLKRNKELGFLCNCRYPTEPYSGPFG